MPEFWRRACRCFGGPDIELGPLLLVALAVRVPAAIFGRGYFFLDHQFQYVDPAWHIASGDSWLRTWEWIDGVRSWAYPGLLAGIFRVLLALGVEDAELMMAGTRLVHAAFSLLPVWATWMLVVRFRQLAGAGPALLLLAYHPVAVYCAVQPNGIAVASGLSVAAVCLFAGPKGYPLLSGLLLGLAFAGRFQDAFFGLALAGFGIAQRRWLALLYLAMGAAIPVLLQGLLDLLTWGRFLHSALLYVETNVLANAATKWGAEPFWFYGVVLAGSLLLVPPFLRSGGAALADAARRLPLPLVAGLLYLLVHSLVARKAIRFVLPGLELVALAYLVGLFAGDRRAPRRALHRRLVIAGHLGLLMVVTFHYPNRGPIEAAMALSSRPDFDGSLTVVGGSDVSVGGHFYLRRASVEVEAVGREEAGARLLSAGDSRPRYALVVGEPLPELPAPLRAELVGRFSNWPDFKRRARRFVYRVTRVE